MYFRKNHNDSFKTALMFIFVCNFKFQFFFNNARIENFNGYEFHFTGFIIFVLRDTQRKSTGTEKQVFIHSLFFIITFSLKRNAMIMHWSIIHLRGKLQYPLYGICRVRAVSRMLKIEPVVLNQEQLLEITLTICANTERCFL